MRTRTCILIFVIVLSVSSGLMAATIASVNGVRIPYELYSEPVKAMPHPAGAARTSKGDAAHPAVLARLMWATLLVDLAEKNGVPVTDEQVNRRLNMVTNSGMWMDPFTPTELLRSGFRANQAGINLAVLFTRDTIRDDEIDKQYAKVKGTKSGPEGVKVAVVRFRNKASADKAAAKLKKGASLAAAAKSARGDLREMIVRNTGARGPQYGAFFKAAFSTPIGKTSAPFMLWSSRGTQGFVILKPVARLAPYVIDEKDARILIREGLAREISQTVPALKKMVDEAVKDAKVQIFEPSLKGAEQDFHGIPESS